MGTSKEENKSCNPEEIISVDPAKRGQTDIIKEQERLLEQAKASLVQKRCAGDPGDASTLPSQCILSGPEKVKSEASGLEQQAVQATRPTPAVRLQQDMQQAQLSPLHSSSGQNQSPDKLDPIKKIDGPHPALPSKLNSIRKDEAPQPSLPSKNPIQPPKFELKDLRKVETKTQDGSGSPVKRSSSFKGS